jgi:hypothetical protein
MSPISMKWLIAALLFAVPALAQPDVSNIPDPTDSVMMAKHRDSLFAALSSRVLTDAFATRLGM